MPDRTVREEPLQFGVGGRLLGVLTEPGTLPPGASSLPVFVFLSAGLLHRVGPSRLHVGLARQLAELGFRSLRVDLAGKGDSQARPGLTNQRSVGADYQEIVEALDSRVGAAPRVLGGICSGADNAVRLAIDDSRVVGMLLLDPICFPDAGYRARQLWAKYTTPARYLTWFRRRTRSLAAEADGAAQAASSGAPVTGLALRDLPTLQQLQLAVDAVGRRQGRVLSVFTQYAVALEYYNRRGQFGRVLEVTGYEHFCVEHFWPDAEHTYRLRQHRERLTEEVTHWALGYMR
jgi:hypothetical protein